MQKILGYDIGPNSIGWALIEYDEYNHSGKIIDIGSRIIPTTKDILDKFSAGMTVSATAQRTQYRGVRRLRERHLLRRSRLLKMLKHMEFIPQNFRAENEDKIQYAKVNGKRTFLFEDSYEEMKQLFENQHGELTQKLPRDWTIYYLRKKGLTQALTPGELAWIILQFNKKRGYCQLRDAEEKKEDNSEKIYIKSTVVNITDEEEISRGSKRYTLQFASGESGTIDLKEKPEWIGQEKEFILTIKINKNGSRNETLKAFEEGEWELKKKRTESAVGKSGKQLGEYIFDLLLENKDTKIIGGAVETVDREFYRQELEAILNKQKEFIPELKNQELTKACVQLLYPKNEAHRNTLLHKDFTYLFATDIIYYQRPLKTKKHLIQGCRYENRYYYKDGELHSKVVKAIPKSHPLYQEFRLWQFIHNLRIIQNEAADEDGVLVRDTDVTDQFLDFDSKELLYNKLLHLKEFSQKQVFKCLSISEKDYKWNYGENKKVEGNQYRASILNRLKKAGIKNADTIIAPLGEQIWHLLYASETKEGIANGLRKLGLDETVTTALMHTPLLKKEYGSLSKKAITKLLPFMRCGQYADLSVIPEKQKKRIASILANENPDELATQQFYKYFGDHLSYENFSGIPTWLAAYAVYGQHSEKENKVYTTPDDLKPLPLHSLRNPTVEKVVNETLALTREIWKTYGRPQAIHVELARDLKKTAAERQQIQKTIDKNEKENNRIKMLLRELKKEGYFHSSSGIKPTSLAQVERMKLWEQQLIVTDENQESPASFFKKTDEPTRKEIERYKLWAEQKHVSIYTGKPIQLSELFTDKYDIEHVLPQSRIKDDAQTNKVICEKAINKDKGNQTGYEYILSKNHKEKVLSPAEYEQLVKKLFSGTKLKKLLATDIPDNFTQQQLNNTKYIAKKVAELLQPVPVQEEENLTPGKLVITNGAITSELRNAWQLGEVFKQLVKWRFERMNTKQETNEWYQKGATPKEDIYKDYSKRIDHRHHAMDALVVACTTQSLIQYFNTLNAQYRDPEKKKAFQHLIYKKSRKFQLPWTGFKTDAYQALSTTVVSFKSNQRIINRTVNNYKKWQQEKNTTTNETVWTKKENQQQNPEQKHWAIRKPMHKESVYGKITVREYKDVTLDTALKTPQNIAPKRVRKKIKQLFDLFNNDLKAIKKHIKDHPLTLDGETIERTTIFTDNTENAVIRKELNPSFTEKIIREKVVSKTTKKILLQHLEKMGNDPKEAFSDEGLHILNKHRKHPIRKVRIYEALGKKFAIGEKGNKKDQFVEAEKGTNLFFVVYKNDETGEHLINENASIPMHQVINTMKNHTPLAEDKPGHHWFTLSPGDLVYMPLEEENTSAIDWDNLTEEETYRIYKMVSCTGVKCYFIPQTLSTVLQKGVEFESQDKSERDLSGQMIKKQCIKLECNRLGQVRPAKTIRYDQTHTLL